MRTRSRFLPLLAAAAALCLTSPAHAAKEVFVRSKPHVNISVLGPDGLVLGGFESVSGLGVETEVLEDATTVRKRPGRTKYSNITLKRGYTSDLGFHDWAHEGIGGSLSMRDLKIVVLSPSAEPLWSFNLMSCFPTKWEVGAESQGGATETIVLTCESVEIP